MHPFPHLYSVTASAGPGGPVTLDSPGLASLSSAAPKEFDGRIDGKTRFTRFVTRATLRLPAGGDAARGKQLLEKAEHVCLVANSLNAERHLEVSVTVA
mgnify:CR=1 FL=1